MKLLYYPVPLVLWTTAVMQKVEQRMEQLPKGLGME
jgi:hypothetical protein